MAESPALRVSDAERERAVELLREHAGEGRLDLTELAERIEAAYAARTREQLDGVLRDLPAWPEHPLPAPRTRADLVVAVMGGGGRGGRFRLARHTNVLSLMGGVRMDLRHAELEAAEASIHVVAIMGGAEVVVPPGVRVELDGFALMGGNRLVDPGEPPPAGAPVVRIRAHALMGGVEVRRVVS